MKPLTKQGLWEDESGARYSADMKKLIKAPTLSKKNVGTVPSSYSPCLFSLVSFFHYPYNENSFFSLYVQHQLY